MNILLCCSGGFSTSLVVSKMKEAAKKLGVDVTIWAVGERDVDEEMKKADILMMAPQIAYRKGSFEKKCQDAGIKFAPISQLDYGRCNGESILKQALSLLG